MTADPGTLAWRLDALDEAVGIAERHHSGDQVASARAVVERSRARLGHGTHHCVIALAGPTGAGKSSLFNALVGDQVSTTGVKRPTTSTTHASVWGTGGSALLDWLAINQRHHVAASPDGPFDGLILLDLPDFDSTQREHRDEVDRLIGLVDLFIWVVDPQKYADHALHDGYLRPLAGHGSVMRFVLSKSDTLSAGELDACVDDFGRRLTDDGIADPTIVATSTATGNGIEALRQTVAGAVSDRRAVTDRVEADLVGAATALHHETSGTGPVIGKRERKELVDRLAHAAGADIAGSIVAAQYKRDAGQALGWPPTRWLRRWRRSPLEDLPTAGSSSVADAEIRLAVRELGDAAGADVDEPWRSTLRRTAQQTHASVASELGAVTLKRARAMRDHPRWWTVFRWLQRVALAVALVGLVWLGAILVVGGFLQLDAEPLTPMIDWMPLPTLLLLAGLAVGLLLSLIAKVPVNVGAARRGAHARAAIAAEVETVADELVIAPVEAAIADRNRYHELLDQVVAA